MNTNASIEITIFQEEQISKNLTSGTFYRDNGTTFIEFQISDSIKTCIGVSENLISINRIGEEYYTMVLELDKPHSFYICTPVGDIMLNATLHKLTTKESENKFELFFIYSLNVLDSSKIASMTKMRLKCETTSNA